MKKLPYLITIFIIFGLVACNGQAATAVPSPVMPTLATNPTLAPSETSPLPDPTMTIDSATMTNEVTLSASANNNCSMDAQGSPDGEWNVMYCSKSSILKVFRVDETVSWEISFENFPWAKDDYPVIGVGSNYWTKDGNFVYLEPYICCIDWSNHIVFIDISSLYRLNLKTGEFSIVFSKENKDLSSFSHAISPNEEYLVYVDLESQPNILHISNLKSGELKSLTLDKPYYDTGAFVWTPDSKKLIFAAGLDDWGNSTQSGITLYSLDINTFSLKTVIDNDTRLLIPIFADTPNNIWKNENTLIVSEYFNATRWTVNIQSGVIEAEITPTHQP